MCPHGYHHSTLKATATVVTTTLLSLLSLLLSFLVHWYQQCVSHIVCPSTLVARTM